MNETKAKKVKAEIEALIKKYGLWFEVTEKNKPELKDITIMISLKVTA